jgi:hypothetical protein
MRNALILLCMLICAVMLFVEAARADGGGDDVIDINDLVTHQIEFKNVDGGLWKQGWPVTYDQSQVRDFVVKTKKQIAPHVCCLCCATLIAFRCFGLSTLINSGPRRTRCKFSSHRTRTTMLGMLVFCLCLRKSQITVSLCYRNGVTTFICMRDCLIET